MKTKLLHRYLIRLLLALCGSALLAGALEHVPYRPTWPPSSLFAAARPPQVMDRKMQRVLPYSRAFQKVVLKSTRDITVHGFRAVDFYWKSVSVSSQPGSNAERITRGIANLYLQLQGTHIGQVSRTPSGWQTKPPGRTLVFMQVKLEPMLPLVLSNSTATPQIFTVASANPVLHVLGKTLTLPAGVSCDIFLRRLAGKVGRLTAPIRVRSANSGTRVPLEFDVRPTGRLVVKVIDFSGHLAPARVFLTGSDGFSHTPEGNVDRGMWRSGEHFFYSEGIVRTQPPPGSSAIEALKGLDYYPAKSEVNIEPGNTTRLVLRLKHLEDMNSQGWYPREDNLHTNYIGDAMGPRDLLLIAQAEGWNVANVGICYSTGQDIYDEKYFEGKSNAVSTKKCILYRDEEMRTDGPCGHLVFLNPKRLVRPIFTGVPHTPYWENYPSNCTQAKKAREQGGFVAYAHPPLSFDKFVWGPRVGESPVDVALGVVDAFEVFCSHDATSMDLWYKFLNLGFKLGITGGRDALFNRTFTFVVGYERVYVYTGREFDYSRWIEALRQDRSFATRGPLLVFKVGGYLPGREFHFSGGPQELRVTARTFSYIPLTKLEIVVNAKVVGHAVGSTRTDHLEWRGMLTFKHSAWMVERVWGPDNRLLANGSSRWSAPRYHSVLLAHTSPSCIEFASSNIDSGRDRDFMLHWIDALVPKLNMAGRLASQANREEVVDQCLWGSRVYEQGGSLRASTD